MGPGESRSRSGRPRSLRRLKSRADRIDEPISGGRVGHTYRYVPNLAFRPRPLAVDMYVSTADVED